jgi:hypothetical protein
MLFYLNSYLKYFNDLIINILRFTLNNFLKFIYFEIKFFF